MGKRVPRRLKRFNRQGTEPTDEAMKGIDENKFFYDPEQKESRTFAGENMTSGKETLGREASSKEIATELALEEVQRFKEMHKRLPEQKEYDSISESIYAQLKDKEQRKKAIERLERKKGRETEKKGEIKGTEKENEKKRKHGRHGHRKEQAKEKGFQTPEKESLEAEETLSDEEIKGMSVEDLFSSDKKEKGNAGFGDLEKIDGDEFSLEGLKGMGEKPSASSKCPKCGAETERVVFCPECGTAFCEKCAKKVEVQGNVKTFVCPSCGKKIKKIV